MGRDVPAEGIVDRARLRQVLLNLAGNGVKFTEAGGVTVSLERGYSSDPDVERVVFSVMDSGPGIPPGKRSAFSASSSGSISALTRRHGGAGLGLAISRRIVRGMGSDIVLDQVPGRGAIFRFALDLKPTNDQSAAVPTELYGRRVLVVAPDGAEPPILAQNLGDARVSARIVASANEAAALAGAAMAAATPYHAVLVDQRVAPDAGKALERIRRGAGARLPAAVLIEPGKRGEIEALRASGFDAYLVRPVRRFSLFRIVGEIIAGLGGFHTDPSDARPASLDTRQRAQRSLDVLLAEDNEINALLVRAVLEGLGHSVTEVRDGQAAVTAATATDAHFGVVLLDLHMPLLDGLAAARLIRAHESGARWPADKTVIIALTADVLAETRAEAEAAGIDAVLAKPIAPESLRRVLANLAA